MKLTDFDYSLPKELIAQYPSKTRGEDRLLVIDRKSNAFTEKSFSDIVNYFKKGDLLILNNTKVMPARIFGKRKTGGKVEIFIIDKTKSPIEALVRPSGKLKEGEEVTIGEDFSATILGRAKVGRFVEFNGNLDEIIKRHGHMPLPPYISRPDEEDDRERYQTVYARKEGATASPTAGLHFTESMIEDLKSRGVNIAHITLHVSYGTFAPIKSDDIKMHKMHSEYYFISADDVNLINSSINQKANIFACGTTSLRAIEACSDKFENFIPQAYNYGGISFKGFEGFTDLFIYPGYKFKIVNKLITNFHLPKSTLLLLTSAFAGKELLFNAYEYAVKNKFKFFSYGDAMIII